MSDYLQFRAGPYRFLMAVTHVVEIGDGDAAAVASAWRQWRGRSLPAVNLACFLGGQGCSRVQQLVLDDGADGLSVVDVDRIDGLVTLRESAFATLSDLSAELGALVDAVTVADDAGCLLRLRHPFAWREATSPLPVAPEPRS